MQRAAAYHPDVTMPAGRYAACLYPLLAFAQVNHPADRSALLFGGMQVDVGRQQPCDPGKPISLSGQSRNAS